MDTDGKDDAWLAVIGRSLAFLCLVNADLRDKGLVPQAKLLETLGLTRTDAARLLDTTVPSLTELLSKDRRRQTSRRGRAHASTKRKKA